MSKRAWERHSTPIFEGDAGKRLKLVRMRHFQDQKQLAKDLGVSHHVISDIERGSLRVARAGFSLARLQVLFGAQDTWFILTGVGGDHLTSNQGAISRRYWEWKLAKSEDVRAEQGKPPVKGSEKWLINVGKRRMKAIKSDDDGSDNNV